MLTQRYDSLNVERRNPTVVKETVVKELPIQQVKQNSVIIYRSKFITLMLALFLGWIGIHRFYLGYSILGLFYLLFSWTFIPMVVGWCEFIIFAFIKEEEFQRRYTERVNIN